MTTYSRRDVLRAGSALALAPALLSLSPAVVWSADPYQDAVLVDGEPPLPEEGSFTVAVLPDTQFYSEKYPETFQAQTNWVLASQRSRNIACVLHLGDITNLNDRPQWENAVSAMSVLDGRLPYFLVAGNHDYSQGVHCADRTTLLNEYFPISKFRELPNFGGTYDQEPNRLENAYYHFSARGRDFLVLALEFGPRRDVIRWANEVVARHRDREAILITHAYLYYDDTRYDWQRYGKQQSWNPHVYGVAQASADDVADGEALWTELVSRHENFVLTVNGHVIGDGLGRLASVTPGQRDVHQILVNFQMRPNGGDGWLRLLEFRADGKTVQTYDYSPTRKQRNESPQNQFSVQLAAVERLIRSIMNSPDVRSRFGPLPRVPAED